MSHITSHATVLLWQEKYRSSGVLRSDPFGTIDLEGVACIIEAACERVRSLHHHSTQVRSWMDEV
jgi:hypothetical protein